MSCLKKCVLLVLVSLCGFSINANAQISQFGVMAGLNLSNVYGNNISDAFPGRELKPGLVIGGYMTYDLAPLLSIQPEVLFSMKGTKGSNDISVPYTYTQTFNYIEVPVLLKVNLPVVPFRTNVFAGPDFAFNVASSEEDVAGGRTFSVDTKNLTRNFDFNLAVGAGAGFGVGPTSLGLELRYTFGTGSLSKTPGASPIRNGVFAIMASVGI